jgi:hypothetical protein
MGWYPRLMQVPLHFIARKTWRLAAAVLVVASAAVRAQQAPAVPAAGESTLILFLNGREVGREQVTLARTPAGWTITSSGAFGAPFNQSTKRFEVTYAPDWQPIELKLDATVQSRPIGLATSFGTTTAINEITNNGVTSTKTDQITARAVVLPSNFFAAYEALAARLSSMTPGSELAVYVAPQGEIKLTVRGITPATYQTPAGALNTRRFAVTLQNPAGPLDAEITVDERNRFAKLDIQAAGLSVARQDVAGVATRQQTTKNPTDIDVKIPAAGFGWPARSPRRPLRAGSGIRPSSSWPAPGGRARRPGRGHSSLRAARRPARGTRLRRAPLRQAGHGSERRPDRARHVPGLCRRRGGCGEMAGETQGCRPRARLRGGHSEGASIGMLASAAEGKIEGLVMMSGMGIPGRELILEQQQHLLGASNLPKQNARRGWSCRRRFSKQR